MAPPLGPDPIRTFVALPLPDRAREAAVRVTNRLRRELGDDRAVKWEPRTNLHVTLHFLGDTDPAAVPSISDALAAALAGRQAFDLGLGAPAWFPGRAAPRIFVVDVATGAAPLAAIQQAVGETLAPFGYPPDRRPFRAHVTVGRVRRNRKLPAPSADLACEAARAAVAAAAARASEVVLFRSTLGPEGATYDRLATFHLAQ